LFSCFFGANHSSYHIIFIGATEQQLASDSQVISTRALKFKIICAIRQLKN